MPDEPLALPTVPPALPAPDDYDVICGTLMRSERGRWFLQEYAKRNRNADTDVLLAAIHRLERVVCADKEEHGRESLRSDLLEMAKAITRTRAEVAGIRPAPAAETGLAAVDPAAPAPESQAPPNDVLAAAQRIRDVTWAMRGHGFDPAVCHQLEELATTILSASSIGDPTDRRTSKLTEVLAYLEQRINDLLGGSIEVKAGLAPDAPVHVNGHNGAHVHHANGSDVALSVPHAMATDDARAQPALRPDIEAAPAAGEPVRANGLALLPDLDLPPSRIMLRPSPTRAVAREATDSALLLGIDTLTTLWTFDAPADVPAPWPRTGTPTEAGPASAARTQAAPMGSSSVQTAPVEEAPFEAAPVEETVEEEPRPGVDDAPEPMAAAAAPRDQPATAPQVDNIAAETTAGPVPEAVASSPTDAPIDAPLESPVPAMPVASPTAQAAAVVPPPHDSLAPLMAMSEAERIALFS